jgi:hypothetical protein
MRGAHIASGLAILVVALGAARCTYSPDFPSGTLKCSTVGSCPEGYACVAPSNTCYKHSEIPAGAAGTGGAVAGTSGAAGKAGAGGTGGAAGATGMAGAGGATGTAGTGGRGGTGGTGGTGGAKGPPCAGTCTIRIDGTLANGNAPSTDSKFVGHWVFQAGSSETVSCSDGSTRTTDLATSGPMSTPDYVDIVVTSMVLNASYFCDWQLGVGPAGNATVIKAGQSCSRNVNDATTGLTHFTWHGTTFTFKTDDSKTGTLTSTIAVDYVDDPAKTGCSL